MSSRKWSVALALAVIGSVLLSACAQPTPEVIEREVTKIVERAGEEVVITQVVEVEVTVEPTPEPEEPIAAEVVDEINVRLLTDMVSVDPFFITTKGDQGLASNIHCNLVNFVPGTSTEIEPDLAEDWSVSEDGLTWTFNLREGASFHKGYGPVTAEDVEWSLERVLDGSTNARYIANISDVEAVDPTTVRIQMSSPQPSLLIALAYRPGYIVPKAAVEEFGQDFGTNPVGCGPYAFESWTPGLEVVLVRNEDYFLPPPAIKRAVFKFIPDETVASLALERQEIDLMTSRSGDVVKALAQNPDLVIEAVASPSHRAIVMKTQEAPFDDIRVRRAVAHAVDRDAIIDVLTPTLVYSDNPLGCYRYAIDDIRKYEHDPEEAKRLLAEAGYPDGFEVEFKFSQLSPWPDIIPLVGEQLAAVGINAQLIPLEHGAWTAFRKTGEYKINMQSLGRPGDPDLPLQIAFNSKNYPPGSNMCYYDQIDDLIEAGATETDESRRAEIYAEIQRQIAEDVPVVQLACQAEPAVYWNYVKGHRIGVNNEIWIKTLSIEK
jgi:peptide/nickel transport system substrate-binding protein